MDYYILILFKVVPESPVDHSIGSDNGLALNRPQAIIQTTADQVL